VPSRNFLSIGEVLLTLKTEFPDITISKIRFLEGEGLIDPERTPSGYRKFYDKDVDLLRSILRLQRDEYLPLKVIKERLEQGEEPEAAPVRKAAAGADAAEDMAMPATGLHMSLEELSQSTGVDKNRIRELESFGLIEAHAANGSTYYDGDDFLVLSIAKDFFKYGVEPRHLKMYLHFAEREATFFESIVMPMLRQKNPDARKAAAEFLNELAVLSRRLKSALLRTNLKQYLQSPQ
jgi:DNA-binding transcriptional MerR regulator